MALSFDSSMEPWVRTMKGKWKSIWADQCFGYLGSGEIPELAFKVKIFSFLFFFFHCFKFIYFLTKLGRETKFKWFNICHPELLSPEFFFKTTLMRGLFLVWADFHFNWCLFLLLYSAWEPVGILKKACCVAECPGRIQHCSSSEEPINHDLETPASVPFSCVQRKRNTGSLLCSFVDTEYLESTRGQIKTCRLELF